MFVPLYRLVLFFVVSACFVRAQNPADMPLRQVIELAQEMIGKGDFAGASPMLDELEVRFEDKKDPAVEKILQQFGFVRGIGYLQSFAKSGNKEFIVKSECLWFLRRNFLMTPKPLWLCKENGLSPIFTRMEKQPRVIETLLDTNQPYRKQILKRSELSICIMAKPNVIILSKTGQKESQHLENY